MAKFRSEGGILLYQLDFTIFLSLASGENSTRKARKHDEVNCNFFPTESFSHTNEFLPDNK